MLDFGLQGKIAIVCASSKGLGAGMCARAVTGGRKFGDVCTR